MTNSSAEDNLNKSYNMSSPSKNSAMTGLVSEAFRKQNKFTHAKMVKVNPQLRPYSSTTSTHQVSNSSDKQTEANTPKQSVLSGNLSQDDEVMSSEIQSDQMTISSPIPLDSHHVAAVPANPTQRKRNSQQESKALQKVINQDIKKRLLPLTQSIQEQNKYSEQQVRDKKMSQSRQPKQSQ